MKVFLAVAAVLVSSSIAAPATDKSVAVRESHLFNAGAQKGTFNALSVELEGLINKPEGQKATTNVKRSKSSKKKALTKTYMISRKKGSPKPHKKHPKRLVKLKLFTTGFTSGPDIINDLDSTLDQVTVHTDNIDTILGQVEAGKLSEKQGTTDTLKEITGIRSILSGLLSRLSATRNTKALSLTDGQRQTIIEEIDQLVTELLRSIEAIIRTLGTSYNMNTSLNPMMNILTGFLGGLATADTGLAIKLRELVSLIIKDQTVDSDKSGLSLLLSGFENSLLRLHGTLKATGKSN
ncbi:hypothetical protein FPSE_10240 [Fusarium pseudograminearum CS3096]|uniref:Uncharacterized protein n=1 Tax=Fusarium pseudograminearum (strain CS3096) TaxID=1028729 RepID=K3V8C2_FUSPC|nr:hypothetical protein FPSE_10240 [Fusarium pseudograminearum CS3096]EKJ69529.1 hypothetical protein FPSE_10240 [Fusarium pseudograminearum CS3096]